MKKHVLAAIALISSLQSVTGFADEFEFEEQHDLPLVYINVVFRSGSVSDPNGLSGITNFVGEAMLRGTQTKTKSELDVALDQIGAKIAVDTRQEAVILRGAVLSKELDPFLSLFSEIILRPRFDKKEIEKLKSEFVSGLLEELSQDRSVATRKFQESFYGDHPYSHSVIGKAKDIRKFDRETVQAQYKRVFSRNGMFAVGSGDASQEKIHRWFTKLTQSLNSQNEVTNVLPPRALTEQRVVLVDKPDRTQTQVLIGQRGISIHDPRYFAFYLGNNAFGGGGFTSRLMTEVRVKRGWSYGASSSMSSGTQAKTWSTFLFPADKDTPDAVALVSQMIGDFAKNGLTEQEFSFSKASLINSAGFMYNTPKKRSENRITEKILGLPTNFMSRFADHLKPVTREQTNQSIREIITPERTLILVLGTSKMLKDRLASRLAVDATKIDVIPYDQE